MKMTLIDCLWFAAGYIIMGFWLGRRWAERSWRGRYLRDWQGVYQMGRRHGIREGVDLIESAAAKVKLQAQAGPLLFDDQGGCQVTLRFEAPPSSAIQKMVDEIMERGRA